MENKRPKMHIPMTTLDILIELAALVLIISTIVYVLLSWAELPNTIPSHFNFKGEIDGYGSKSTLLVFLPVSVILYIGLTLLAKYPHIYNYVVEINDENAEQQYKLATAFMRILKLEVVLLFSYISIIMVLSAKEGRYVLGIWFLPITLAVMFASIGIYIYKSVKAK